MANRVDAGTWILSILAWVLVAGQTAYGAPLGSTFTYQGQLKVSGQPASGLYDLQACLFDDPSNPLPLACIASIDDVPVEDGLFSVALDFGNTPFAGEQRFLELRVRAGASTGAYTILTPRQAIRAAPEALRAAASSAAPWSGLGGVPAGFADGIDNDSGGMVTSVAVGTGLGGGTITSTGTISIANGGVGSTQIADASVQAVDIAPDSMGSGQIASNGVGAAELADNAVDSAALVNASVTSAKIAAGAVGAGQIAAGAVGLAQIDTAQVQSRIGGTCVVGTYLRGIDPDGSPVCLELPGVTTITVVDNPANSVGQYGDIAIGADGLPVISYRDDTDFALKVARCADSACTGAATITVVDGPSFVFYSSIAIGTDGIPVIGYYDGSLRVAKCANAACTGAATITLVDNIGNVGLYPSIAIGADGLPVISYHSVSANSLKVAKCANAACTGAATITTVDDPAVNNVGRYTSIVIGADGLPAISYQDFTAFSLKVAKCANAACTGAATITTVDDPSFLVGEFSAMAIGVDGLPVIAYHDITGGRLKVAKCANAACTGSATITPVDDPANAVGLYTSIAIGADGLPVVGYHDGTAGALKVAKCANAACTGTSTITTVDNPANSVGEHAAIAIGADGLPVLSYQDSTDGALKVAKCGSRSCR